MATEHSRSTARLMMAPAVLLLLVWMLVPLSLTVIFSFKKFLPLRGDEIKSGWDWITFFPSLEWVGWENYSRFLSSSSFWPSIQATLLIVGLVLIITVLLGIVLALLLDQ